MKKKPEQGYLSIPAEGPGGTIMVNERCRIHESAGHRAVSVLGIVVAHYAVGDRAAEAYAIVNLVEQGWALQSEVAHAFGQDVRTVRRNQRRLEEGGMVALGRPDGFPSGKARLHHSRSRKVHEWKAEGLSNREIARRLGVTENVVRKVLRRLGWKEKSPEQGQLAFMGADPNLSGSAKGHGESIAIACTEPARETIPDTASSAPPAHPNLSGSAKEPGENIEKTSGKTAKEALPDTAATALPAHPNLSGSDVPSEPVPFTLDTDPEDRRLDRFLAYLGAIDDAVPMFGPGEKVPGVGALLAIPALIEIGVLDAAGKVYGSLGPAFYGLRTTVMTLLLMALLRMARPEALKESPPRDLGRVLGLDRAPEVKTLRTKLARLSAAGRASFFGQELAQRRVSARGQALGFLYVDGHVRVYHGKRPIPKTHVARMRICMPATTDYWVNDAAGEPLLLVPCEANKGLASMLPPILQEVRSLVGERRVTVVFDRGGWSPKLFENLILEGFDILTYRKGRFRKVARKNFQLREATLDGQLVEYRLADQGMRLSSGLRLRQVTRLSDDGKQTPIITSRRDLPAVEVAYRMFSRWRQENFFKYLREEYALDALVEYDTEPADPTREVPNPARAKIDSELKQAQVVLNDLLALYGLEAITNAESLRRTMRGFKIANAPAAKEVVGTLKRITDLKRRRAAIPARIPVCKARPEEVLKLAEERQHLCNLLKMVAYQAESDLVRILAPSYRRAEDEGRTLIQSMLAQTGDLRVAENTLEVRLDPLSSPHRTQAMAELCGHLNATRSRFPGSSLQLKFEVKSSPKPCPAFPGPRTVGTLKQG